MDVSFKFLNLNNVLGVLLLVLPLVTEAQELESFDTATATSSITQTADSLRKVAPFDPSNALYLRTADFF